MILKDWRQGESINDVELSYAQFWVQIHGLPMESLDEDNAILIGCKLGVVDKVARVDVNRPYL